MTARDLRYVTDRKNRKIAKTHLLEEKERTTRGHVSRTLGEYYRIRYYLSSAKLNTVD
jgi:hypothetical protein